MQTLAVDTFISGNWLWYAVRGIITSSSIFSTKSDHWLCNSWLKYVGEKYSYLYSGAEDNGTSPWHF